jgi:hypothetical protein
MLVFGKMFCVLCDHQVSKRQARRLNGRRYVAVWMSRLMATRGVDLCAM